MTTAEIVGCILLVRGGVVVGEAIIGTVPFAGTW